MTTDTDEGAPLVVPPPPDSDELDGCVLCGSEPVAWSVRVLNPAKKLWVAAAVYEQDGAVTRTPPFAVVANPALEGIWDLCGYCAGRVDRHDWPLLASRMIVRLVAALPADEPDASDEVIRCAVGQFFAELFGDPYVKTFVGGAGRARGRTGR